MPYSVELRQQVEDLALRLVIGEPGADSPDSRWLPALQAIHESAVRENASELAAAALALVGAIQRGGPASATDSISAELQEGITRLQQALDASADDVANSEKPPAQDPELLGDFILESREHLANIETQALTLEREPCDSEALNSVFRGFHTIKGLAGFLELWEVQKMAHETETILDRARSLEWTITPAAIDLILASADYLRRWLTHVESDLQNKPSTAPASDEALLARLRALCSETAPVVPASEDLSRMAAAIEPEKSSEPEKGSEPGKPAEPEKAEEATAAPVAATEQRRNETMAVKVDTAKLDYLVDMAGEMVIAESLVRHDPELANLKTPRLQRNMAQLKRITAELQRTAMAMRLVPIGPLFRRMARLVRDLSRQFGKQVQMETEGEEIELDRTIVEELADPLMHMVRNALDHGIEGPQERLQRGKPAGARLLLKAQHRAGQVVIEIADDGRGLDRDKIRNKAIQKGLISAEKELTDNEIFNLVFEPGFSTAAQVTNVSGRGVGMDVVRRHIEKLRGRIEIRSTTGQGACFLLKLPLTLAIIDGLVVGVGGERYIAPLFSVREMFRPTQDTIWTVQQRSEMALIRGNLLPVLRLYRRFHVTPRSEDPLQSVLVVTEVEGQHYCLLVDELIGKQEVVIKSLGETFQNVAGIAGGAILGDGRVGLILDLEKLLKEGTSDAAR